MPELRRITEAEMRELLREAYSRDPEQSFLQQLMRSLSDPAMPRDAKDRLRVHPLWLTLGLIAMLVLAIFLYFTFLSP